MPAIYAVRVGRQGPALYRSWTECEKAVKGYVGARHKKFASVEEAERFISEVDAPPPRTTVDVTESSKDLLIIYADGSALSNGRAGARAGAGVYFGPNDKRNQSVRVRATEAQTNQRAELLAATLALRHAGNTALPLEIRTDSRYVVMGATEWLHNWKMNGFQSAARQAILHQDLWQEIDQLCQERTGQVIWRHVKGHSNEPGNDAADALAKQGAMLDVVKV